MRFHSVLTVLLAIGTIAATEPAASQSAPKPAKTTAETGTSEVSVADRAAQMEDRLIDLQVQIATMKSLAATVEPAATGVAPSQKFQPGIVQTGNRQRIAALEGEVRTLASQIRQLSGKPGSIQPGATSALRPGADDRSPQAMPAPASPVSGWSGTTTVLPNNGQQVDPQPAPLSPSPATGQQGELLPGSVFGSQSQPPAAASSAQGNTVAGWAKPSTPAGDHESEYQTAYSYLLQQDYGAAEAAFGEFLARYPETPLAGNAQYWIGETHYVRGAYKKAAVAFLKGYEKYGDGNKGPDSLLKLALALGKLRQQAAACSSLRELGTRYRNAPPNLLSRAKSEQQRLRCPN